MFIFQSADCPGKIFVTRIFEMRIVSTLVVVIRWAAANFEISIFFTHLKIN